MNKIVVAVDLRALFGPARSQGPRPACMAFAASDAHAGLRPGWSPLSCEYIFYHAQRRAGRPPTSGALLSSVLEALREDGQPEEGGWPYLAVTPTDVVTWKPPAQVGALFGRNGRKVGFGVDELTRELDQGRPVIILLTLSRSFYARLVQGVVDPAIDEIPEPQRRHAVIAVGYGTVNGQRAILVRNSWGAVWGDGGYGWLTERFLIPRIFAAALLLEDVNVSPRSASA